MNVTYIRTTDGQFLCPHPGCGAIKRRQNTMRYHILRHNNAFTHFCTETGCGAGFTQKSGLDQHMAQKHRNESAFTCHFCDASFKVKVNLQIHIGRKHGKGWIQPLDESKTCAGCKKSYKDKSETGYFYHAVDCFRSAASPEIAAGLKVLDEVPKALNEGQPPVDKDLPPVEPKVLLEDEADLIKG